MSNPEARLSLGDEIAAHAAGSSLAYFGYVWILHAAEFPDDYRQTQKRLDYDPSVTARDYAKWETITPQEHKELLLQQLILTFKRSIQETKATRQYEAAAAQGEITVQQNYLTTIVGPLAMKRVAEERWWSAKNEHLAHLQNPFFDTDLLEGFWKYTSDRRRHRTLGRFLCGNRLAPGYLPE